MQTDCGYGIKCAWSDYEFSTIYTPLQLDTLINFNNTTVNTLPDDWLYIAQRLTSGWETVAIPNANIPQCVTDIRRGNVGASLKLQSYNSSTTNGLRMTNAVAISPTIDVENINTVQIAFWLYSSKLDFPLHVGLLSYQNDLTTWEEIATINTNAINTWEEFIIPFDQAESNGKYVAFMVDSRDINSAVTMYIDDISFEMIPPCPKASYTRARNIKSTQVDFVWTGTAQNYNIKVSERPIPSDSLDLVTNIAFNQTVTTMPYTVTGLQPQTDYYFYIQPSCGTDGLGTWSNEASFRTACDVQTLPFFENFDSYQDGDFPDCWHNIKSSTNLTNVYAYATYAHSAPNSLYIRSTTGAYSILSAPELDIDSIQKVGLNFWTRMGYTYYTLEVGIMTDYTDASTFEPLYNIIPKATVPEEHTFYFTNYKGNGKFIAFRATNSSLCNIDDVRIFEIGDCVTPTVLESEVTSTTALLRWQKIGDTNSYRVKVAAKALANPETAVGSVYDGTVNADSLLLQGLQGSSIYYFYIKAICDDVSDWREITFSTACGSITALPFFEDFEDYGAGANSATNYYAFPPCWTRAEQNSTAPYIYSSTSYNSSKRKIVNGALYLTASKTARTMAVLPELNVPGVNIQDVKISGSMYTTTITNAVSIGVVNSPTDTASFVEIGKFLLPKASVHTPFEFTFENYTGTGKYIAIRSRVQGTNTSNTIYIDDIYIELNNQCSSPSNLHAIVASENSITISFDETGSATQWKLYYGVEGFDPYAANANVIDLTSTTHTITGLSPETTYEFYVRANCGSTDGLSNMNQYPLVALTSGVPTYLPLITGFEEDTDNAKWLIDNGECINQWIFGSADKRSGEKAMYISNNGVDYQYTNTNGTSYIYASRLIHLEVGEVTITYDYKGKGRNNYDFMEVYLVPASTKLPEAGQYVYSNYYQSNSTTLPEEYIVVAKQLITDTTWTLVEKSVLIDNPGNYNLVFYWQNYATTSNYNKPAIVDNLRVNQISCGTPGKVNADYRATTANLSWTSYNGATQWRIRLSETALSSEDLIYGTGNGIDTLVNTNPLYLSALSPETTYYTYIQSICAVGDSSDWATYVFTTECEAISQFPYRENFDSYSGSQNVSCWTKVIKPTASSSLPYTSTSYNHTEGGTTCYYFYTTSAQEILVATQRIDVESVNELEIEFYGKHSKEAHRLIIGAMSNIEDASTFVPVDTAVITKENEGKWTKFVVNFANYQGNGQFIAFRAQNTMTNYFYLDDIVIRKHRSCAMPQDVIVDRIDTTSARLNWTGSVGALYNIKISTSPIYPDTDNANVLFVEGIQDPFYSFSGLTSGTKYYCYVQADCDNNSLSNWSDEVVFSTNCDVVETLPYEIGFGGGATGVGSFPDCWNYVVEKANVLQDPTSSYIYEPYCITSVYSGGDQTSLKMYAYYKAASGTTTPKQSSKVYCIAPQMQSSIDTLQLSFSYYFNSTGVSAKIGVVDNMSDMSTFTPVYTLKSTNTSWNNTTITMDSYEGEGKHIAFMIDGGDTTKIFSFYLDNLKIDTIRSCEAPINLNADSITDTSAYLTWEAAVLTDTIWHLQVSPTSLYYTSYVDTLTDFVLDTIINAKSFTITRLQQRTNYAFYVRPMCSDSTFGLRNTRPYDFRTGCGLQSVPLFDNFDTYGTGSLKKPECDIYPSGNYSSYPYITSSYVEGDNNVGCYYFGSSSTLSTIGAMPEFDIDSVSKLKMYFRIYNHSTSYRGDIHIGVMEDPTVRTSFDSITVLMPDAIQKWQTVSASFSSYQGNGKHIAFRSDNIALNKSNYVYMDNLYVTTHDDFSYIMEIAIDSVRATQALISWEALDGQTSWEIVYGLKGFDPYQATPTVVNTNPAWISGLTPNTIYEVYVRGRGDNDYVNTQWFASQFFASEQTPNTVPYTHTFADETENSQWMLYPNINTDDNNNWVIGSAVNYIDNKSLYISNTNGLTHTYDDTEGTLNYAYRTFDLEMGKYDVNFKWLNEGDTKYDHIVVVMAPADIQIQSGTAYHAFSTVNTDLVYNFPDNWIKISEQLHDQSTWQNFKGTADVAESGLYNLIFLWRTNGGQPCGKPAAIDSIAITELPCYEPFGLSAKDVAPNSVTLTWAAGSEKYIIKVDSVERTNAQLDNLSSAVFQSETTTREIEVNGLNSNSIYYYYIQAICNGDTMPWVGSSFQTLCDIIIIDENNSYFDDFDGYGTASKTIPSCWTTVTTYRSQVSSSSCELTDYPYCYTGNYYSGSKGFYFYNSYYSYCSGSNSYTYAATPIIGTPISQLQASFKIMQTMNNSYIKVGVMTDPNDYSTFVQVDSIVPRATSVWEDVLVNFSNYQGNGKHIAFLIDKMKSGSSSIVIDDLTIELGEPCASPKLIRASHITQDSALITWTGTNFDTQYRVKIGTTDFDPATEDGNFMDTIVSIPSLQLGGLYTGKSYVVYVQNMCDTTNSRWTTGAVFTTACGEVSVPYSESFLQPTTGAPNCWTRYKELASDVFTNNSSLSTTGSSWVRVVTGYGISNPHMKVTVSGINNNHWLVSPTVNLTSNAILSFDLALTKSGTNDAIVDKLAQADDKFMVIISEDNGATWSRSNATLWSETNDKDYRYSDINHRSSRIRISLAEYGGKQIKIAFYVESTVAGGVNDIHVGNIAIVTGLTSDVNDVVCEGYPYNGNGFAISADDLELIDAPYLFTRFGFNNNGVDTIVNLHLNINPSVISYFNDSTCANSSYNGYGFDIVSAESKTYRRNLLAASGCDSIIYLNMFTYPSDIITVYDTICENDTHLIYNDSPISASGIYTYTLTSTHGCDSIVELDVTVYETYEYTENIVITTDKLPYSYGDTIIGAETTKGEYAYHFKRVSQQGCDSITHLLLTVEDANAIINTEIGHLFIYPNPVMHGEVVYVDITLNQEELDGLIVEVYNSIGQRESIFEANSYPIRIDRLDVAGVYVIKLTTRTNQVYYGKVIVQ